MFFQLHDPQCQCVVAVCMNIHSGYRLLWFSSIIDVRMNSDFDLPLYSIDSNATTVHQRHSSVSLLVAVDSADTYARQIISIEYIRCSDLFSSYTSFCSFSATKVVNCMQLPSYHQSEWFSDLLIRLSVQV